MICARKNRAFLPSHTRQHICCAGRKHHARLPDGTIMCTPTRCNRLAKADDCVGLSSDARATRFGCSKPYSGDGMPLLKILRASADLQAVVTRSRRRHRPLRGGGIPLNRPDLRSHTLVGLLFLSPYYGTPSTTRTNGPSAYIAKYD